jgi:hypothetical protein
MTSSTSLYNAAIFLFSLATVYFVDSPPPKAERKLKNVAFNNDDDSVVDRLKIHERLLVLLMLSFGGDLMMIMGRN